MSNEKKLTEENRRAIDAAADYFVAHVDPEKDERTKGR
jgi:hypothetical protein